KKLYQFTMKHRVEAQPGLTLRQEIVEGILIEDNPPRLEDGRSRIEKTSNLDPQSSIHNLQPRRRVVGIQTKGGTLYRARAVVLTTGTFLKALMHMGEAKTKGGRAGDQSAESLSDSLTSCGFELARFETGTPCRLNGRTIDFSQMEVQPGDADPRPFSFS